MRHLCGILFAQQFYFEKVLRCYIGLGVTENLNKILEL